MSRWLIDRIWLLICFIVTISPVALAIGLGIIYENSKFLGLIALLGLTIPLGLAILMIRVSSELSKTIDISEKE